MGALVTKALRPIKSWNIENRAHRVISKEKPEAAPKYPSNVADIQRALESDPDLVDRLKTKNPELDDRLRNVYVTSRGPAPEDVLPKHRLNPSRPLPQDRKMPEEYEYGLKEPEKITYGRTTLRNTINFIAAHQANPKEVTVSKIAFEHKLKEEDVAEILKYFKSFEVYLPETAKTPARFAGPAQVRKLGEQAEKQLESNEKKEVEQKT